MPLRHTTFAIAVVAGLVVAGAWFVSPSPSGVAYAQSGSELSDRFAAACETDNPFFVTPFYAQGYVPDAPALIAFHDSGENSDQHTLARFEQIGAAFGVAYHRFDDQLYVAAVHKRGSPFGPGGPGTIYRVDIKSLGVEAWLTVPDAGPDTHDPTDNYIPDLPAKVPTGRTSLGDIDLNDDASELFVMNLHSRTILRYRVADKTLLGSFGHGAAGEPWAAEEARPYGLKYYDGKLYHGVVRSASQSQEHSDLTGYVYRSNPDGSDMARVLELNMAYERGRTFQFNPWDDSGKTSIPDDDNQIIYPQPMLSDIEFTDGGDMVLAVRDRLGDATLYERRFMLPEGEKNGISGGDTLLARKEGDAFTVDPWPEFFAKDAGPGMGSTGGFHKETGFGGLGRVYRTHRVVTTGVSPLEYHGGGAYWFSLDDGSNTGREQIYVAREGGVNYGKANGLGDVELMCREARPTETPTEVQPTDTPTDTPKPADTPAPTETPVPTDTPVPTMTPGRDTPPAPTWTPTDTPRATPTDRPEEKDTPKPPDTPAPADTPDLPKLPKTGRAEAQGYDPARGFAPWAVVGAAMLAAVAIRVRRRRET